ncbi:hypothetical protein Ae717Ps2_3936 [Pseudonocardia sp. Ae717_Ps2]|nr:hypothetical protein Ae717Ps2_3936 [Pseudonocardia sp. Ae717_Ps2]
MALVRSVASKTGSEEYDVRVGIEWSGDEPLTIVMDDGYGFVHDLSSTPLHQFVPVDSTIDASESDLDYFWHVHDLAEDCINQGGVSNVSMIRPPARDDNN